MMPNLRRHAPLRAALAVLAALLLATGCGPRTTGGDPDEGDITVAYLDFTALDQAIVSLRYEASLDGADAKPLAAMKRPGNQVWSLAIAIPMEKLPGAPGALTVLVEGMDAEGCVVARERVALQVNAERPTRHAMMLAPSPQRLCPVEIDVQGAGQVTLAALSGEPAEPPAPCLNHCRWLLPRGATAELRARPAAGSSFAGWSGACGALRPCTLLVMGEQAVKARNLPLLSDCAAEGQPCVASFPDQRLRWVAALPTGEVFTGGAGGVVLRWSEELGVWAQEASAEATTVTLNAAQFWDTASDASVVGEDGVVLLRGADGQWQKGLRKPAKGIAAVCGQPGLTRRAFAVGQDGLVLRRDGSDWWEVEQSGALPDLRALSCGAAVVYAGGAQGQVFQHGAAGGWSPLPARPAAGTVNALWLLGPAEDLWAASSDGRAFVYDGGGWSERSPPLPKSRDLPLNALWGPPSGAALFAVSSADCPDAACPGIPGQLWRSQPDGAGDWQPIDLGPVGSARGVAGAGGTVWVVGDGFIARVPNAY